MKYLKIAQEIINQIENNTLKENERLEAEKSQAQKYQVSINTIKKAMEHLISLGYIRVINQSGYYVNCADIYQTIQAQHLKHPSQTSSFNTKINKFEITKCDNFIADKFNINSGTKVYHMICSHFDQNNDLISIQESYLPLDLLKKITIDELRDSIYNYISQKHNIYFIKNEIINISRIHPTLFEFINEENWHKPCSKIIKTSYLDSGRIFECSRIYSFQNQEPIITCKY